MDVPVSTVFAIVDLHQALELASLYISKTPANSTRMTLERFDVLAVLFSLLVKALKGKRRHRGGSPWLLPLHHTAVTSCQPGALQKY